MKKIKVGIFGGGRGADVAGNFLLLGCDVCALCDNRPQRLERGAKLLPAGTKLFTDFDEFINSGLDAVMIANNFHEHTPYVIKCFEKNIHVFCECISNGTMAEGVMLHDAFKNTKSIFMLAENVPNMKFCREIKRVCDTGSLGKIMYAESEYNHPGKPGNEKAIREYNYSLKHWRNYLPSTYYITHTLGPVMWLTGAAPKRVTAFSIYAPPTGDSASGKQTGDRAAIITTVNDDGSVFRVTGNTAFGGRHYSCRVCGSDGQVENLRGTSDQIMVRYNEWTTPEGFEKDNMYEAQWNDPDEDLIAKTRGGHGGADLLTVRIFVDCIKEGRQPEFPYDLKSSIAMSSCAILAHRSALEGGRPFDIPDFDNEADRALYENDRLSPFFGEDGSAPTLPCCATHPDYKCPDAQLEKFKEIIDRVTE